jgi:Flp pilus assembly protein TadG
MRFDPLSTCNEGAVSFLEDKRGGAAIVMAILTPVLIGGLAFGAEVGYWELEKRKIQNAADTAAHAAGTQLRSGITDDATLEAIALAIAEVGGFKGGDPNITLVQPPSSGAYSGNANALSVSLAGQISRKFSGIYSSTPIAYTATSTVLVNNGRPACVLALHPTTSGAISTGGSTNVALAGCDIAANSMSQSAITSTGNGSSVAAECISAVGNVSVNSTYNLVCAAPIANSPKAPDPYSSVPEPTCASSQNPTQFTRANGNATSRPGQNSADSILCYSGNAWNFSNNIELASGKVYVLENTGSSAQSLTLNGGRSITGTNVTLYFKGKWNLTMNGNSTLSITAQTTGPYKGLALWGDRNNEVDMNLTGNNGAFIVGAVYSPNSLSDVTYTGSNTSYSSGQCTQVIAGTVRFWGNSNFSTNCANSGTTPIRVAQSVRIVE